MPQENGGALFAGNWGNRGGGRRPSAAHEAARREAKLRAHLDSLPILTTFEDSQAWLCAVAGLAARGLLDSSQAAVIIRAVEAWVRVEHARGNRDRVRGLEQKVEELERRLDLTRQGMGANNAA